MHQEDGTVLHAVFTLNGQSFMAVDNINKEEHSFTPAMSLFVTCGTEEEIERVFRKLSEDGTVLMPLAAIPVSKKFGWVQDNYSVSWQLNHAKSE